jgi:hypothetical protein
VEVRNTAVPGTRVGGDASTLWMKTSSGIASSASRCISTTRPRFQVVSSVNTMPPISSGNQPPSGILSEFEARNTTSTIRNGVATSAATSLGQCQSLRITTKIRMESISIAIMTAMPYALASASELWNPTTSAITAQKSDQLMKGT